MKFLHIGIFISAVLMAASVMFGQQFYAVTGGRADDVPQLTVINVNTQQIVGRLPVPATVGGVVFSRLNPTIVYATLYGSPENPANSMIIVNIGNPADPNVVATVDNVCGDRPWGNGPTGIALTPNEAFAYIACQGSPLLGRMAGKWVAKVNTTTRAVTQINVGQPGDETPSPFAVMAHPTGGEIWVSLYGTPLNQKSKIVRVSVNNDQILGTIRAGRGPTKGSFSPTGEFAYVPINGDHQMAKIDLQGRVLGTLPIGLGLTSVVFAQGGLLAYAAGYGSFLQPDNKLVVIDHAFDPPRVAVFKNDIPPGSGPFQVALTPNGQYLLLTLFGSLGAQGRTVQIYQREPLQLLQTLDIGPAPSGIDTTSF